ncbi:hypothetical protein D3C86_2173720 [compost metagenome]
MGFTRAIPLNHLRLASGLLLFFFRSMDINKVTVAADLILEAAAVHIIIDT